jgi:hypothetical protein
MHHKTIIFGYIKSVIMSEEYINCQSKQCCLQEIYSVKINNFRLGEFVHHTL